MSDSQEIAWKILLAVMKKVHKEEFDENQPLRPAEDTGEAKANPPAIPKVRDGQDSDQ